MAEGDIGTELDRLEFETTRCLYPRIVHVVGDIYAIAFTGDGGHGWITTVSVDSAGAIPAAVEDSLDFAATGAYDIDFCKVANGVFAVVYRDNVNDGQIKTISINASGTISVAGMDTFEFEAGAAYDPKIIKVASNVFAVAYMPASVEGKVITVGINDAGAITDPVLDSLVFEGTRCVRPCIIHVVGDIFAIAYEGVDDHGWMVTVEIDSTGAIPATVEDSFEFDPAVVSRVHIAQRSDSIYVIVYTNSATNGDIVTVSISAAGNIGAAILDDQVFATPAVTDSRVINVSGDVIAIVYKGQFDDGFIVTWAISDAGVIAGAYIDEVEYDANQGTYPNIMHVSGNIYAITYADIDVDGQIITYAIETVAAAAATQHLMMTGIG